MKSQISSKVRSSLSQTSPTPAASLWENTKQWKNCVAGCGDRQIDSKEKCCLRENFHSFLLCTCTTIFFLIIIANLLAENCTLRNFYRNPSAEIQVGFIDWSGIGVRQNARNGKKLENFHGVKLYDFIFSYERRICRTEKKLMWRKKIFSFFHSESANLSVIFFQSNANFLPTFHFYMIS